MLKDTYNLDISLQDLADIHPSAYILLDTRDAISHEYGCIPNSLSMPDIYLQAKEKTLDASKSYVLYCMHGRDSFFLAEKLQELGYDAISLEGGDASDLRSTLSTLDEEKKYNVERSIIKTYRKQLLSPFLKALDRYQLIQEGDKIAVCISGGKDSMLMAKLFQEVLKFSKVHFEVVFLCMDPGYSELNRLVIEENAKALGVPLTIFESTIFDAV